MNARDDEETIGNAATAMAARSPVVSEACRFPSAYVAKISSASEPWLRAKVGASGEPVPKAGHAASGASGG